MNVVIYEPISNLVVDLHARLTLLLHPRNDPPPAKRIAIFSKVWRTAGGSIFDARNRRFWLEFRCKSTGAAFACRAGYRRYRALSKLLGANS